MKDDCPIVSYSIVKVIDKNSRELITLADSLKKFKLDSLGNFSVLDSNLSYQNYQIYIQAENQFGITGGANEYLIDVSYKVIL